MGNCIVQKHSISDSTKYQKSRFKFIQVIGRGSFGEVWKVVDKLSGELCALKIMDKVKIIIAKSTKTVIQEKRILDTLATDRSDLISNIKASFQDREKVYLLMEYITGRNLRAYLTKERKLNEQQIKFVVVTLLKIVRYIHSKNIIHGDIKPQNIMINHQGLPHVTDFGIASFFKRNNAQDNGGTLPYMAPEVIQGLNHTFSIDYYAIGIITYELFFHERPHQGNSHQEIEAEILNKTVNTSSCPKLASIPPAAADFIMQLLQRDSDDRLGKKSIQQIFQHPWIKSQSNASLIVRNDCQVFEDQVAKPMKSFEAHEIESDGEENEIMRKLLDRQHIQKMFAPFSGVSIQRERQESVMLPSMRQPQRSYSLTAQEFYASRKQSIAV